MHDTAAHPSRARRRLRTALLVGLLALGLLAACDDDHGDEAPADADGGASGAVGAVTTAEEIYRDLSPSIAFISTPLGLGSAIQIDERHVLTNAHVVWPHREARVVYPDGTEITDAAVVGWNLLTDIAVIDVGPAAPAPPLRTASAAGLAPGAQVYLIGYPAEPEEFPQPTITGGLLSRFRQWRAADLTYIQTDAAIAGGQSGGALVAADGAVIGISGFSFSDAGFGVVADIEAALDGARAIIAGEADPIGQRAFPVSGGAQEQRLTLAHFYAERAFLFTVEADREYAISAESEADILLRVTSADGAEIAFADDTVDGREEAFLFGLEAGDYIVVVAQYGIEPADVTLAADVALRSLDDRDDGTLLRPGVTYAALDYVGDIDDFEIDLTEGVEVTITVGSPNIDAFVSLDHPRNEFDVLASDDDSGGGLFGVDASFTFTPDRTDRYLLTVSDALSSTTGGYLIHVEERPAD